MTTPHKQENTNEWAARLQASFEDVNSIMEATAPTVAPPTDTQPDPEPVIPWELYIHGVLTEEELTRRAVAYKQWHLAHGAQPHDIDNNIVHSTQGFPELPPTLPERLMSVVNKQLDASSSATSATTPPVVSEDDAVRAIEDGDAVWLSEVNVDPLLDDDLSVSGDPLEESLEDSLEGVWDDNTPDGESGWVDSVSRDPLDGLLDESLLRWELVGVLKDEGGEGERFAGVFDYMRNAPRLVVSDRGGSVLSEVILTRDVARRLADGLGMVNRVWGGGDAVEKEFSWGGFFAGRVAWFRRHWIKGSVLLGFGSVTLVLVLMGLVKMMFA